MRVNIKSPIKTLAFSLGLIVSTSFVGLSAHAYGADPVSAFFSAVTQIPAAIKESWDEIWDSRRAAQVSEERNAVKEKELQALRMLSIDELQLGYDKLLGEYEAVEEECEVSCKRVSRVETGCLSDAVDSGLIGQLSRGGNEIGKELAACATKLDLLLYELKNIDSVLVELDKDMEPGYELESEGEITFAQ